MTRTPNTPRSQRKYRRRSFHLVVGREELSVLYGQSEDCLTRVVIRGGAHWGVVERVAGICLGREDRQKLREALIEREGEAGS